LLRQGVLWPREDVMCRPMLNYNAPIHDKDSICDSPRKSDFVRHYNHGGTLASEFLNRI
jgi:hypothetical protein